MNRRRIALAVTLLVLGIAGPAFAGYDEAQELYKQQKYAEAAREYEAGIAEKPKHAMAYYKLGLTYAKLNRHADAVAAHEKALALDPGLASRTKINESLEKARAKAGRAPASTNRRAGADNRRPNTDNRRPATTTGNAAVADKDMVGVLQKDLIYVDPAMQGKLSPAQADELRAKLKAYDPPIKLVAVKEAEVRKHATSLPAYANKLHGYLQMPKGAALIVVSDKGVAAVDGSLSASQIAPVVKAALPAFSGGYVAGVTKLAGGIKEARSEDRNASMGFWFILLSLIGGGAGFWFWRRSVKAKAAKAEVQEVMGRFYDSMAAVNDNMRYFAKDPKARDASQLFDEATAVYKNVETRLPETKNPATLKQMAASLEHALGMMTEAGEILSALLEGKEPPARRNTLTAKQVLASEASGGPDVGTDSGCFFCSRPTNAQEGSIIELQRDGKRAKVLACPDCAGEYAQGRHPQVAGSMQGGRFVPWYEMPDYRYGHDRGGMSFTDYWLISHMFDSSHHHHYGSSHYGGPHRRDDDYESRMSHATEGTVSDFSERSSDSGDAAGGSFWSSSSSDQS